MFMLEEFIGENVIKSAHLQHGEFLIGMTINEHFYVIFDAEITPQGHYAEVLLALLFIAAYINRQPYKPKAGKPI